MERIAAHDGLADWVMAASKQVLSPLGRTITFSICRHFVVVLIRRWASFVKICSSPVVPGLPVETFFAALSAWDLSVSPFDCDTTRVTSPCFRLRIKDE
jgi:hypothetical protein